MNTYETDRLILRPPNDEDADFFIDLYNSRKFIEFIGDKKLRTKEDAVKYINEKFLPQFHKIGFGNYVIINKKTNVKVGSVGIFERDGLDVFDIGYSLLERYEGYGFAYEAADKLKSVAKREFGLKALSAITTENNIASQNLIKKLGLTFIKKTTLPNDPEELLYYEAEL